MQVLDYQHSQRTLFPLLATAYAFHFTGEYMKRMYYKFEKDSRQGGDFSALPELHATSSGLKAWCTWKTKDGLEMSRLVRARVCVQPELQGGLGRVGGALACDSGESAVEGA
jgi:hypothetical protein